MNYKIKLTAWNTGDVIKEIDLPFIPNEGDVIDLSEENGTQFEITKRKINPTKKRSGLYDVEGFYLVTLKGTVKETKVDQRPFHI